MRAQFYALFVTSLCGLSTSRSISKRQQAAQPAPSSAELPPPGTPGIGTTVVATFNGGTMGNTAAQTMAATPPPAAGQAQAPADINLVVLNFALTLENLESQFYQDALALFPPQVMQQAGLSAFQATAITQQIQRQLIDEQSHVSTLQAAIQGAGATPFAGCQYNFRSVLTDPVTFLSSARSIEAAGVSAYIGGASLITNPAVLGAAATILPIEARHSSILNMFSGGSTSPQSYDIPLSPPQVLAVVGGLLQNCQASDLGLTANQPLSVIDGVSQSTLFTTGSILQFQTSAQIQNLQANTLSCQMLYGGTTNAIVMPASSCIIPAQVAGGPTNGIAAVFLTSNAQPLSTNIASQPQNVVAGPALIFVDSNQQDVLPQLFTINNLNLKSLPTANLAAAALTPQRAIGVNRRVEISNDGASASSKSLEADVGSSETESAMFPPGCNEELKKMSWSAMPKGVIQSPSQVKGTKD
ncbi:ferritin-like domain-containing protein [Phakopsora pachyrhizi]|uniref:Ferritin-like domain-domain-containing protein n=1 Tax=Phakopsora pachyrhizi TaxID=170000 RepID=A0AAV0AEE0_PHAPC|nr:ferritin-like domain-containing protein [Phakopsora pachyrhizi]CAH7665761.1 ferritin-like domain-domain-containing protein [Phakopsora pachyrhizi]